MIWGGGRRTPPENHVIYDPQIPPWTDPVQPPILAPVVSPGVSAGCPGGGPLGSPLGRPPPEVPGGIPWGDLLGGPGPPLDASEDLEGLQKIALRISEALLLHEMFDVQPIVGQLYVTDGGSFGMSSWLSARDVI